VILKFAWNGTHFLKIRHVLDVMHCEKNLYENLLRTLLGETDNTRAREDMMDMEIREELWLRPRSFYKTTSYLCNEPDREARISSLH
jgi:hypothetical protein